MEALARKRYVEAIAQSEQRTYSIDWEEVNNHCVQFYENDTALAESAGGFLSAAILKREGGVIIATAEHTQAIKDALISRGITVNTLIKTGQLVFLDAAKTLDKILLNNWPDSGAFRQVIGSVVAKTARAYGYVRVFGETVALLWERGNRKAALRLEIFWSDLAQEQKFFLFCVYPLRAFLGSDYKQEFNAVYKCHDHVIPARSKTEEEHLHAVARWQHNFSLLEAEIMHRKEIERMLKETDRRKDEFLAMLAHELRNPLAPIKNALHILEAPNAMDAIKEEARAIIQRQVRQMQRLIDDLMDVSRITHDKIELQKQEVLLGDIIKSATEIAYPLIIEKGHSLEIRLPKEPLWLQADTVRMSQVFANLLNNAAKYTDTGGKIVLNATVESAEVLVSVKDNGIGIPQDVLSSVFDLFVQVDNSLERKRGGLGIGLTLVKKLVELHTGYVKAYSQGEGMGSEFKVCLPVLQKSEDSVPVPSSSDETALPRRVLVVDDSEASAWTLGLALELAGHKTVQANDAESALEKAKEFKPHIILLDIGLPDISGYELCKMLRQLAELKNTMIIAQTGWGQNEHRDLSKAAGFDYHLVKPVDMQKLKELIASYKGM